MSSEKTTGPVGLVLDWDGTVTERDTLDLVLQEFGTAEIYERAEQELEAGRMTLNEVISMEFETVTAPLDEVVAYVVEHARVRPGFTELARIRRPLVVSSGFHELIEPVLERERVLGAVELRANRVEARADGWRVHYRIAETCPACGEPCKRGDLPPGEVVYAGDGHSDYCAALAADRVFATGSLARWLRGRGVSFTPLTDFRALAAEL
jgi:2-hydroxy-3-keto-5-methylthiopentenyl-1-phosphate phosphatase